MRGDLALISGKNRVLDKYMRDYIYVTGSWKTKLLEQAKMLVINVPIDRTEHRLHNDILSVHIPGFIPELCALETQSRKM